MFLVMWGEEADFITMVEEDGTVVEGGRPQVRAALSESPIIVEERAEDGADMIVRYRRGTPEQGG